MHLCRLTLTNFRNLQDLELHPDPVFNVFWGDNAQGKTNLLEAIYLLSHLKSFRGARNTELLRHGEDSGRLCGQIDHAGVEHTLSLDLEQESKRPLVNGKTVRKAGDFFGYLRTVLFSPEELSLAKGSPAGRRALMDRAIFQTDSTYLERVQEFNRVLKQRNRLLKERHNEADLEPWNEALVRSGALIRACRQDYINRLRPLFQEAYRNLGESSEKPDLRYRPANEAESLQEELRRELSKKRQRERELGQTLVGPHRDEIFFELNDRPLRLFGSQGQQRSFVLAFKAAQIMDLEALYAQPPVLLLDDMTSELDQRRQNGFFQFLLARRGQVFITTTDIEALQREGMQSGRLFRVVNGALQDHCRV